MPRRSFRSSLTRPFAELTNLVRPSLHADRGISPLSFSALKKSGGIGSFDCDGPSARASTDSANRRSISGPTRDRRSLSPEEEDERWADLGREFEEMDLDEPDDNALQRELAAEEVSFDFGASTTSQSSNPHHQRAQSLDTGCNQTTVRAHTTSRAAHRRSSASTSSPRTSFGSTASGFGLSSPLSLTSSLATSLGASVPPSKQLPMAHYSPAAVEAGEIEVARTRPISRASVGPVLVETCPTPMKSRTSFEPEPESDEDELELELSGAEDEDETAKIPPHQQYQQQQQAEAEKVAFPSLSRGTGQVDEFGRRRTAGPRPSTDSSQFAAYYADSTARTGSTAYPLEAIIDQLLNGPLSGRYTPTSPTPEVPAAYLPPMVSPRTRQKPIRRDRASSLSLCSHALAHPPLPRSPRERPYKVPFLSFLLPSGMLGGGRGSGKWGDTLGPMEYRERRESSMAFKLRETPRKLSSSMSRSREKRTSISSTLMAALSPRRRSMAMESPKEERRKSTGSRLSMSFSLFGGKADKRASLQRSPTTSRLVRMSMDSYRSHEEQERSRIETPTPGAAMSPLRQSMQAVEEEERRTSFDGGPVQREKRSSFQVKRKPIPEMREEGEWEAVFV